MLLPQKSIYHGDTETLRRPRIPRAPQCLRASVVQFLPFAVSAKLDLHASQSAGPDEQVGDELGIELSDFDLPASLRLGDDAVAVATVNQAADPVVGEVGHQ